MDLIRNTTQLRSPCGNPLQWHLNGNTKGKKQFGAPEGRSFGFNETSLLWNRGHWKFLDNRKGNVTGLTYKQGLKRFSSEQLSDFYTTDFLTNETINYIQSQKSLNKHFALVVSYPDPHGTFLMHVLFTPDTSDNMSPQSHRTYFMQLPSRSDHHMTPCSMK